MRLLPIRATSLAWSLLILPLCARSPAQDLQPRSIFNGHTSFVYCVAVSPDGKALASGARDGSVICWDAAAARPKWTAEAHRDNGNGYTQVSSVAFSPDGKTLASGGWDKAVRFWDAATGELRLTLPHVGLVYSVAFSPDGKTLASGEHGTGIIRLWDAKTGKSTGILADERLHAEDGRQDAADVDDEHHRVAPLHARIELDEGVADGRAEQRRVEERERGA